MTNTEIIQAIKAEIERLKGICTAQIKVNPGQTFPFVMEMTGYDKILSFLDTLESEKPTNQSTRQRLAEWSKTPEGRAAYEKVAEEMRNEIAIANNLKESENLMQDRLAADLEKEIKDTCRSYRINESHEQELGKQDIENIARHFAQWQYQKDRGEFAQIKAKTWSEGFDACKEQMLKTAVEGLICATITGTNAISFLSPLPKELTTGDKVRIIILPKED